MSEVRAVYYRDEDHLGVWLRLLIDAIDTTVAVTLSIIPSIFAAYLLPRSLQFLGVLLAWTVVWIGYFVVLKGSRFRTLGYVIAGARVVNLRGERPRYLALFARLMFVIFGPGNFLLDLLWVSSDPSRQALRDKFAHTWVVRKNAAPAGAARIVYPVYTTFGWTLMLAEVVPLTSAADSSSTA